MQYHITYIVNYEIRTLGSTYSVLEKMYIEAGLSLLLTLL